MPTEQSVTYEESRKILSIENISGTMARNQYQHCWTITKIKWQECNSGHSRLIYKDNQTQGNNNSSIIKRNS